MNKTIIKSDDTEIEECEFHKYKSPISVKDIDSNEFLFYDKNETLFDKYMIIWGKN